MHKAHSGVFVRPFIGLFHLLGMRMK